MQENRSRSGALGNNYARPARSRQESYLSVKVALPSTARPALAELPSVAPARLGPPVIVLAARCASVRAAPRVRSILRFDCQSLRSFRVEDRFAAASPVHPPPHICPPPAGGRPLF